MDFLTEPIKEVVQYILDPTIISPGFAVFWETARIIFLLISAFLLGLIIFLLSVNDYFEWRYAETYNELHKVKPRFRVDITKRWKEVKSYLQSQDDSDRRLAIIDADDILNDVLGKIGYEGDDTYDKLIRLNEDIVPNIEELKEAYKIKKEIMHDPNKELSIKEAEDLVSRYEAVLKDLQVV